jgi:hypothetical protein
MEVARTAARQFSSDFAEEDALTLVEQSLRQCSHTSYLVLMNYEMSRRSSGGSKQVVELCTDNLILMNEVREALYTSTNLSKLCCCWYSSNLKVSRYVSLMQSKICPLKECEVVCEVFNDCIKLLSETHRRPSTTEYS